MPFCSNCGEKVEPGAKFCSVCGSTLKPDDRVALPSAAQKAERGIRPSLIASLVCLAVGSLVLGLGLIFLSAVRGEAAFVMGGILVLLGATSLGTGYGIYRLAKWGRGVGNIAGTGFVAFGAFLLIVPSLIVYGVGSIVMGAGLIMFLRRPEVRRSFGD